MGTGEATGENRAVNAAESALRNPLLGDVELLDSAGDRDPSIQIAV